jgi:hypothetical protein
MVFAAEQDVDGAPAEFVVRQREGGELRLKPGGDRVVVEGDNRHVRGHPETGDGERLTRTQRKPVVETDQCPRPGGGEQGLGAAVSILGLPVHVAERTRVPDPGRGEGLADASQPLDRGDAIRRPLALARSGAYQVDAIPVAGAEQHGGRLPASRDLVRDDGRDGGRHGGGLLRQCVEQDGRGIKERLGHRDLAGVHRGQDQAVGAPVMHRLDQPPLQVLVSLGLADEQQVAPLARGLQRPLDQGARVRGGRHRVRDEADGARNALAQAHRDIVRPVLKLAGSLPDPALHLIGDAHLAPATRQHERRRGRRHARRLSDVGQGDAPGGHLRRPEQVRRGLLTGLTTAGTGVMLPHS